MSFKTDYLDDVFAGSRKYRVVPNDDGTYNIEDVTEYSQTGDTFGSKEINEIGAYLNGLRHDHVVAGGATGNTVVVPASSFIENLDINSAYYPYCAYITVEGMTSTCYAEVVYSPETDAMYCMSGKVKTADGRLYLYADSLPTKDVKISTLIWKELR